MHAEKLLLHSFPLLPMTFYSKGLPLNPIFQGFQLLIQMGQLSELRSSRLLRRSKTLMHLLQESIRKPKSLESFEHSQPERALGERQSTAGKPQQEKDVGPI